MAELITCTHPTLAPLSAEITSLGFGAVTLHEFLDDLLEKIPGWWRNDFFPAPELLDTLLDLTDFEIAAPDGEIVAASGSKPRRRIPAAGVTIKMPWDLLAAAELYLPSLRENHLDGTVHPSAVLDGVVTLGQNSRILPGVYIEGNCIIGKNCKIGPNCYLRGNTIIGDNCHIGQAVEIKNSIINSRTNVPHLSYVGDSVIGSGVNLGAGTIISNFRHDGKNHRSQICGQLVDTGRRKFGAIIGDGVHTGINTSIYPGRKLFPGTSTLPGAIIKYELQ